MAVGNKTIRSRGNCPWAIVRSRCPLTMFTIISFNVFFVFHSKIIPAYEAEVIPSGYFFFNLRQKSRRKVIYTGCFTKWYRKLNHYKTYIYENISMKLLRNVHHTNKFLSTEFPNRTPCIQPTTLHYVYHLFLRLSGVWSSQACLIFLFKSSIVLYSFLYTMDFRWPKENNRRE